MHSSNVRKLLPFTILLAGIVITLLWLLDLNPPVNTSTAATDKSALHLHDPATRVEFSHSPERTDATGGLRLRLVNVSGSAIAGGAAVFGEATARRVATPSPDDNFSDAAGSLIVPRSRIHAAYTTGLRLTIVHALYQPLLVPLEQAIAYEESGSVLEVVLHQGVSQMFQLRGWDSQPIANLCVYLSMFDDPPTGLSVDSDVIGDSVSISATSGVFRATSNALGVAAFTGLMPGHYRVFLRPSRNLAVRSLPGRGRIQIPQAMVDIELWPVYAGLIKFADEVPTLYRCDITGGTQGNGTTGQLAAVRQSLVAEAGGAAMAWAMLPDITKHPDTGAPILSTPQVRLRAFHRNGWIRESLSLTPLAEGLTAKQAQTPHKTESVGQLKLDWPSRLLPALLVASERGDYLVRFDRTPLLSLPAGSYQVSPVYAEDLRLLPPRTVRVEGGATTIFQPEIAPGRVGLLVVRATSSGGRPLNTAGVRVSTGGRLVAERRVEASGDVTFLLEVGSYLVRVMAAGAQDVELSARVDGLMHPAHVSATLKAQDSR